MALIDIIAGARPNFIKISPIIKAIEQINSNQKLKYRLVHTGQHYDTNMSGSFFDQLGIPSPHINLEIGSGTQAEQTAQIMMAYESLLLDAPADLCLVSGDVNSTMACALTARKLNISVAHVEAGIRSGDWSMPEEINRIVTDSICDYFFTTSKTADENLIKNGVGSERIFFVGNTMIDTLLSNQERLTKPEIWDEKKLSKQNYLLLTLHRPANVDSASNLENLIQSICDASRGLPVIFPLHPRTASVLKEINTIPLNVHTMEPQPYLQFGYLAKHAKAIITDSGGITEEATLYNVPCITLRDSTERPETVTIGTNELIGTKIETIKPTLDRLFAGKWKKGKIPELWDGNAGNRIAKILATHIDYA